jgi:hypothetical protein
MLTGSYVTACPLRRRPFAVCVSLAANGQAEHVQVPVVLLFASEPARRTTLTGIVTAMNQMEIGGDVVWRRHNSDGGGCDQCALS